MDLFNKIVKNLSKNSDAEMMITKDIKKDKRKKKKDIERKDGVILETDQIKYINYKDIRSRKYFEIKENILEWSSRDFVFYAKNLYYKKYNKDCGLQVPMACKTINELKSEIENIFISCNNILIKDYIDFFFDNYLENIINNGKDFYFSQLKDYKIITVFYNNYGEVKKKNKISDEITDTLDNKIMESLYFLDKESFVYKYGIILSINWLIFKRNLTIKEAKKSVNKICKIAYYKKLFNIIEKSTEQFSPYPDWLKVKKVGSKVNVNIEFNSLEETENKYSFLRR